VYLSGKTCMTGDEIEQFIGSLTRSQLKLLRKVAMTVIAKGKVSVH